MADALLDQARPDATRATVLKERAFPNGRMSGGPSCEFESRTRLLDLTVGCVEDLWREGARPEPGPEGFCDHFQICLPYRGLFVWHVGEDEVVGDANQVVFVRGGEAYRMRSPLPDGYAELIITPDLDILSEVAHTHGQRLGDHPLFARRSCRAEPRLQRFRARFQCWAANGCERDALEAEELVLALVRVALQQDVGQNLQTGTRTARLLRRTKEFLEGRLSSRILLTDIARAVGASPAYLTDLFRRIEGVSLHQYLTQLRLARALVELPHADDLTRLALDIGFSSHSHFTFAFRRSFGCTPSQFRQMASRAAKVCVREEHGGARRPSGG